MNSAGSTIPRGSRLLMCSVLALALTGCVPASKPTPSALGGLKVLAAESFLADIAQHVAGDRLVVESLLAPGIDPHEFQATPQDAIKIAASDVLIINGLGYEAWLTKTLGVGESQHMTIVASQGLTSATDADPHRWMNPLEVVQYVDNIRDGLSKADPSGASLYAANADRYKGELRDLDTWIKAEVAGIPAERRVLITNHHALQAFADAYGFEIAGVVIPGFTSEAAPSAQQMAELLRTIESRKVPAIFLDVSENPDLARQIAAESGAKVVTGLYVETVSGPDGPAPTYLGMLKHDVQLIVEALK